MLFGVCVCVCECVTFDCQLNQAEVLPAIAFVPMHHCHPAHYVASHSVIELNCGDRLELRRVNKNNPASKSNRSNPINRVEIYLIISAHS